MAEDSIETEVAVGHVIRGELAGVWRYWCSCGEITAVDTDAAQDHAEDVTP